MALTEFMTECTRLEGVRPAHELSTLRAANAQLHWFAGVQIRNVATLAGNIVTGSPISDLNPIWVATGTTIIMNSKEGGERKVPAGNFFHGYRCTTCSCSRLPGLPVCNCCACCVFSPSYTWASLQRLHHQEADDRMRRMLAGRWT